MRKTEALKGAAGVVLAVIAVNVLVRVLPLPDVDLPAISLPDLPAWVDTALKVKNWLIGVVVVVIVLLVAIDELGKRRRAR